MMVETRSFKGNCEIPSYFVDFFVFVVDQLLISPSLASVKRCFVLCSVWTFARSCFAFSSVEIKSNDGYQIGRRISSDNDRPDLYHVISFIQPEPAVINLIGGLLRINTASQAVSIAIFRLGFQYDFYSVFQRAFVSMRGYHFLEDVLSFPDVTKRSEFFQRQLSKYLSLQVDTFMHNIW